MPNYPYTFQLPPLNVQDIPNDGVAGQFLGINGSGALDWLPVSSASGDMLKSENLSGLASYPAARTNLGLGTTDTPTFKNLVISTGSIATSAPVTISQTWGGTGSTAFTALKVNATTTTGSAATAKILELQHSSLDRFSVQKDGVTTIGASDAGSATQMLNLVNQYGSVGFLIGGGGRLGFFAGYEHISFFNSGILTLNSSTSHLGIGPNVILARDGADNTLALRNGAAAQTFRVYNTYSNAGADTEYIQISATSSGHRIGTNSSGTGVSRALLLGSGGGSQWNINTSGHLGTFGSDNLYDIGASGANRPRNVYVGTNLTVGNTLSVVICDVTAVRLASNGTGCVIRQDSNGIIRLSNNNETDFNRLQFGGSTDAAPAIARDGAGIKFTGAAAGLTSHIKVPPVAVSALPLAATAGVGARAFVNDATSPVFGSAVTGGGSVPVPVYSTGSAWNVG